MKFHRRHADSYLRMEQYDYLGMTVLLASPRMRVLLENARRVARTSVTVLISGESGSGKEAVARAVHCHSTRVAKPWVDVNCGALPENLVESELFGYERGAFSGAAGSKPGLFELAHQGTLFLDEIGELDPRMQVKLLRVLDGVPYFRLGGTRKVSVDVRIVAATNRDLKALVSAGSFRNDLFYRLSEVTLNVPPLRSRPEDIVLLARYFLNQTQPDGQISEAAERRLREYSWPGNVRELRNVIRKAALLGNGGELEAEDLEFDRIVQPDGETTDGDELGELERVAVLRVLKQTKGHQQEAADVLGISRRTLSRRIREYGVKTRRTA